MMSHPQEHAENQDLMFQAYLYVAGEMSEDQAIAFESQMIDSPELCDMVAQASMLNELLIAEYSAKKNLQVMPLAEQDIRILRQKSPLKSPFKSLLKSTWGITTLAGSVLTLLLGLYIAIQFSPASSSLPENKTIVEKESPKQDLSVQQMSGLLDEYLNPQPGIPDGVTVSMLETMDDEQDSPVLATDLVTHTDVPDWLMLALEVDQGSSTEKDDI